MFVVEFIYYLTEIFCSELGHSADKFGKLIDIQTSCLWVGILIIFSILLEKIEHSVELLLIPGVTVTVFLHQVFDQDLSIFLRHWVGLVIQIESIEWSFNKAFELGFDFSFSTSGHDFNLTINNYNYEKVWI